MGVTVFELDCYRPLSDVFEQLKNEEQVIFLDSSEQSEQGRFSLIGYAPLVTIEQIGEKCLVNGLPGELDFYETLKAYLQEFAEPNSTHLPLIGGALGYLGYDFGRRCAGVGTRHGADKACMSDAAAFSDAPAASNAVMPDACMVFYDILLIEDHAQRKLHVCSQGQTMTPDQAFSWAQHVVETCPAAPAVVRHNSLAAYRSRFTEQEYQQALERMVEYMLEGHIYVANMTQQLTLQAEKDPYDIYRYLRTYNPAPFSAYFRGCFAGARYDVCCSSMERFLQVRGGHVVTRPIKGTRPRGATPEEDARNRAELFSSPKDNSELLMIVDLERNDLSLACKPGTVHTHDEFTVETYPTVFHLVATVEGELRDDATALDVVRCAFPGGSITGAPKIRAMEIIDELERSARGLYTGSIGYFSSAGDCDFNVVIRTLVCQNGTATLGVGGGITAESDFDFEFQETLQKALALREAIGAVL